MALFLWVLCLLCHLVLFNALNDPEHAVIVSAYYKMDSKRGTAKNSDEVYFQYFEHTLLINCHCVFFYDTEASYRKLHAIRNDSYHTTWIQRNASEFHTFGRTPSLASIWMEKVEMIHLASKVVNAEWYAWVDAGIVSYRYNTPPSAHWPETNLTLKYPPNQVVYHNFRGRFSISGTAYLVPSSMLKIFYYLFYAHLEMCFLHHPPKSETAVACHDDQVLLAHVLEHSPHYFYNDQIQGLNWGALITENYLTPHQLEAGACVQWTGKELGWCPYR